MAGDPQMHAVEGIEPERGHEHAGIVEGDQAGIEQGVELGGEQEAVEDIEALGIGGAGGPRFGVAGAKKVGKVDSRCSG
jgi:hypothetical protein